MLHRGPTVEKVLFSTPVCRFLKPIVGFCGCASSEDGPLQLWNLLYVSSEFELACHRDAGMS